MSTSSCCQCRSARFDIDLYGRLFIPNSITQKISIVDNNDNLILQFGEYGNWDSQMKGTGNLVPTDEIPFACPMGVAASENYCYVDDLINTRIARIQYTYALNNIPGNGTGKEVAGISKSPEALLISAAPNPMTTSAMISYRANGSGTIAIYDITGKVVWQKSIKGAGRISWNGLSQSNRPVAGGMYIAKLLCGDKEVRKMLVLTK
jgi:hypothetical protein